MFLIWMRGILCWKEDEAMWAAGATKSDVDHH